MNKIKRKETVNKELKECFSKNTYTELILLSNQEFNISLELLENAVVEVYHYGKDVTGSIEIHLKGKNAKVNYHYNTVNFKDNKVKVAVFHDEIKTTSLLKFHGYNQEDRQLSFYIDVNIPKGMAGSIAEQENRIYNKTLGKASIFPNLYVDEYDVVANHSSFTGPFDSNIEFYMKTRGLPKEKIEQLLLEGFLIQEGLTEEEKVSFFEKK